ncbi:MAG: hypothetical protein JHC82_16820, partial [Stenotrophomonas sp.]|nr:hypothetical protein [Stenotrophomonas sp.]
HPERDLAHRGSDGTRFLSRVAPLQQPGWQVVLSADRDLLLADLRRVAHWAVALGLLGVGVWLLLVRPPAAADGSAHRRRAPLQRRALPPAVASAPPR